MVPALSFDPGSSNGNTGILYRMHYDGFQGLERCQSRTVVYCTPQLSVHMTYDCWQLHSFPRNSFIFALTVFRVMTISKTMDDVHSIMCVNSSHANAVVPGNVESEFLIMELLLLALFKSLPMHVMYLNSHYAQGLCTYCKNGYTTSG